MHKLNNLVRTGIKLDAERMTFVGIATSPAPVDVSSLEISFSTSSSLTSTNSNTPGEMIFERLS